MSETEKILEAWRKWAKAAWNPDLTSELDWARERALHEWDDAVAALEAVDPLAVELNLRSRP
jgi:hypothetical protein